MCNRTVEEAKQYFFSSLENFTTLREDAERNATGGTLDSIHDAVYYILYCWGMAEKYGQHFSVKHWDESTYLVLKNLRTLRSTLPKKPAQF